MVSSLLTVAVDAHDPHRLAGFWAGLLGRRIVEDPDGVSLPGSDTQVGLRFARAPAGQPGPSRLHLHLTSTGATGQLDTVATALGLGATHLDVGQRPEEEHVVLADPEGNAFCVIEPGNAFLDGCGLLGEVACDGGREVGVFWSAALGWPLVWDEDGETAVQSPYGGTKVAWGGPADGPSRGRSRQRLELTVPEAASASEVARLVALGATVTRAEGGDRVELTDPGGGELALLAG